MQRPELTGVVSVEGFVAFVVIVGVFVAILMALRKRDTDQAAAREHDALQELQRSRAQELAQARASIRRLIADSQSRMSALPELVTRASTRLEQADRDFSENAYAPFWSAIEDAALALATYEANVEEVGRNASEYANCAAIAKTSVSPFDLGAVDLPNVAATLERMYALVRAAQTDFHFATIYEQRKTNQLLVAGFQTLEQALGQLADRFDSSLENLSQSITSAISTGLANQTQNLVNATAAQTADLVSASASQTAALAGQSAALREEMRASRGVAEKESRARMRKNVAAGEHFVR